MCSWTYYRIPKDSKEQISLYRHIRDLTHAHTHTHEQQWTITRNYEQWRWTLRIGNPHSTPCPTLEATFGITRLVDKTWVVPSSLGNVLVSVVRPVIWCQESWDNVIMSQAHGGRQVMGMKGMWDSSECPKKRSSFEIMFPSEQCCFMVGTLQRKSLWLESSTKVTCLKESSRKKGRGKVSKYLPNFGGYGIRNMLILGNPSI